MVDYITDQLTEAHEYPAHSLINAGGYWRLLFFFAVSVFVFLSSFVRFLWYKCIQINPFKVACDGVTLLDFLDSFVSLDLSI